MTGLSTANAAEAAKYVHGPSITLGSSLYDLERPNPEIFDIEDYAYGLAFTVRFRGQTKCRGERVFYGVGEHNCRGAENLLAEGYGREHALAFLFHESGELPFGDLPGPAKNLFPEWRPLERLHCAAINERFGIDTPDPDLIKRFDLRMYATEARDLMGRTKDDASPGFEPFAAPIIPFDHPRDAAVRFLRLYRTLTR
jgi:hypothetical protein